jgi:hypothetical protein
MIWNQIVVIGDGLDPDHHLFISDGLDPDHQ